MSEQEQCAERVTKGLDRLSATIAALSATMEVASHQFAEFGRICEERRREFEETLADDERCVYSREMEAGAGWLDAAVAIEDRRERRSS